MQLHQLEAYEFEFGMGEIGFMWSEWVTSICVVQDLMGSLCVTLKGKKKEKGKGKGEGKPSSCGHWYASILLNEYKEEIVKKTLICGNDFGWYNTTTS